MEPKPQQINDIELARIAAEAEKPLRDIARQEDLNLNETEKKTLDSVAEKLGELALNKNVEDQVDKKESESELIENLLHTLESNPNAKFVVFGIGNIAASPDGDSKGRKGFRYDIEKKSLVRDFGSSLASLFDKDTLDNESNLLPFYVKKIIEINGEETIWLGFKENVRGDKESPLFDDIRMGNRLFVGLEIKKEGNYSDTELSALKGFQGMSEDNPETFIQLVESLCNKYIPEYYSEIKRLEGKFKNL